jgi:hypothetical protein
MTPVSSKTTGSYTEFILRERIIYIYILLSLEAVEMILGKSMFQCITVREKN